MSDICIISEFNPMHNGHAYIVEKAREAGAESVSIVMSGNATQRGELAVCDKYARAEAAIRSGVDLALELPFPWCAASADYFALAGAYIASRVSDTLLFGSECGDIKLLCAAADYCESQEFGEEYAARKQSTGAAEAFLSLLSEQGFEALRSNDLLGVAYLRAVKRLSLPLECLTVKREGAAYNDTELADGELPSATAIRRLLASGIEGAPLPVPPATRRMLEDAERAGELTDTRLALDLALGFFRLADADGLCDVAESGGGLVNRIIAAAAESLTGEEMFERVRTKRYTDARLRRAMLFSMTGVKASALDSLPEYTCLLGANARGRELLSKNRKADGVRIVTKPADAPRSAPQYACSARLDSLFGLARAQRKTAADYARKNAYIEIGEKT